MKASKFTYAQKAFVVKQGEEGTPVAEICRKAGIRQATYFNWKKRYAGLTPSEMLRLRELRAPHLQPSQAMRQWRPAMMDLAPLPSRRPASTLLACLQPMT